MYMVHAITNLLACEMKLHAHSSVIPNINISILTFSLFEKLNSAFVFYIWFDIINLQRGFTVIRTVEWDLFSYRTAFQDQYSIDIVIWQYLIFRHPHEIFGNKRPKGPSTVTLRTLKFKIWTLQVKSWRSGRPISGYV